MKKRSYVKPESSNILIIQNSSFMTASKPSGEIEGTETYIKGLFDPSCFGAVDDAKALIDLAKNGELDKEYGPVDLCINNNVSRCISNINSSYKDYNATFYVKRTGSDLYELRYRVSDLKCIK